MEPFSFLATFTSLIFFGIGLSLLLHAFQHVDGVDRLDWIVLSLLCIFISVMFLLFLV